MRKKVIMIKSEKDILNNKWGKLIKKETKKDAFIFFNILRDFLLMRFFNVKNPLYNYNYNVFLFKFENLSNNIVFINNIFYRKLFLIIKNIRKSIILKEKFYIKFLLSKLNIHLKVLVRKMKVVKCFNIERRFLWKLGRKKALRVKPILIKKVIKLETNISLFAERFFRNKAKFIILYDYLLNRYKKSFKKRIIYLRTKKKNTLSFLRKKFISYLLYKKWRRKTIKPKYLHLNLRNKKKKYLHKDKKIKYTNKMFNKYSKNKRRFKKLIRRRKRLFRRKYFLMKKFKKLKTRRRKIRTAILHFRSYYSNYYVTLTDLSYNVVCSFSAGSVSESNNKKTKMSKIVAMPIFFRILQFLKAYRIRRLKIIIRNRMDKMFYSALNYFKDQGYKFKSFSFVSRNAHHLGQRTKKPRRI